MPRSYRAWSHPVSEENIADIKKMKGKGKKLKPTSIYSLVDRWHLCHGQQDTSSMGVLFVFQSHLFGYISERGQQMN